jgi:hypothetical protein
VAAVAEQQPPAGNKGLSDRNRQLISELHGRYGQAVIREVRRWLRASTKIRTAVSTTVVAQSIWEEVSSQLRDVDLDDEQGAWRVLLDVANDWLCHSAEGVLLDAARRHCEAWNRYATRHPQLSLDAAAPGEDGTPPGADLADLRSESPLIAALENECAALFLTLAEGERQRVGRAVARDEQAIGLVRRLTRREREVFGHKLAGRTRPEIAALLGVATGQVDDAWEAIRRKARELAD